MKGRDVLFSSQSDEWETPPELFEKLNSIYGFTLDPCASEKNHKLPVYWDRHDDGLSCSWANHKLFVNPPYSDVGRWVRKAYEEIYVGNAILTVLLLPSRTDTKWFHDYAQIGHIEFLKGRLKFVGAKSSAPFPSMILTFIRPLK